MDTSTLENWLWDAACSIRGPLDAPKFKDYILPLLFLKRLSDVFDDELAVIGSANCNRRGWTHDSEVNAFIFDDTSASMALMATTFAQGLRMQLWSEHMNVPTSVVTDGVASAGLWLSLPPGAHVMRYNPTAGADTTPDVVCNATVGTIDPII